MKKLLILFIFLFSQAFGATYELKELVTVKSQPKAKFWELWIPLPYENSWQRVKEISVRSPFPFTVVKEGEYGNRYLHIEGREAIREPFSVEVKVVVERKKLSPVKRCSGVPVRYYLSDKLVPVEKFRRMAKRIVRGEKTDVGKLKAIYDYVVSHMKYDKSGKGWGRGDAIWACDAKRGNCTDFHSLFIALCRAVGIPAVFEIGLPVNGSGEIKGYHCWVIAFPESYTYGIDASEAAKHPEKRKYYFGHLDDRRIGISRGRDLLLSPPQHGERLNYNYRAYLEVDLKPSSAVETRFFVRKVNR